ncbi:MAG: hypothetical protein ACREU7_11605, partial [Burkholderiales bacterium]
NYTQEGKELIEKTPCMQKCIDMHEAQHVEDFKRWNICKQDTKEKKPEPKGEWPRKLDKTVQNKKPKRTYRDETECAAYKKSLKCMKDLLASNPDDAGCCYDPEWLKKEIKFEEGKVKEHCKD